MSFLVPKTGTIPLRNNLIKSSNPNPYPSNGIIYVGGADALYRISGSGKILATNSQLKGLLSIEVTPFGYMYACDGTNIYRIDYALNILKTIADPSAIDVFVDPGENYYIVTHTGITKWAKDATQYTWTYSIPGSYSILAKRSCAIDGNGHTYIGMGSGNQVTAGPATIVTLDKTGNAIHSFDLFNRSSGIIGLFIDTFEYLHCGSPGDGTPGEVGLASFDAFGQTVQFQYINLGSAPTALGIDSNNNSYYVPGGQPYANIQVYDNSGTLLFSNFGGTSGDICIDNQNNKYRSSGGVLTKFDKNNQQIYSLPISGIGPVSAWPGRNDIFRYTPAPQKPVNLSFSQTGSKTGSLSWSYSNNQVVGIDWYLNNVKQNSDPLYVSSIDITNLVENQNNSIRLQAHNLNDKRSDFSLPLNVYGGLINPDPATLVYVDRVTTAGGTIQNEFFVDAFIKKLKAIGIYNNLLFAIDPQWGVLADGSGKVSTMYDLSLNENDPNYSTGPTLQKDSTLNNKYAFYYNGANRIYYNPIELMSSTGFVVAKCTDTGTRMLLANANNYEQIRESGNIEINGVYNLGYPSYSGFTNTNWHLAEWLLVKSATAQVGANGTFGTQTTHSQPSWPVNEIGARSSSNYWLGSMTGIYIFDTILSVANRQAMESFIMNYYGITA